MNRQCLICDSSAVLTRDAAKGPPLLAGLFNGAHARGAEDVVRFHFAGFDCLYLHCEALSDETAERTEDLSPG
ncbi:hypothetical protein AJ60_05693 [Pseudomonas aeruginosa 3573]|nr:hypothetical protein AJ60_05693 [Pseudomonas aeruginosa 3573]